ncbi:MAG TPA: YcaO-like family protein [Syntrophales bacterium]|nr:YcaO-like family protein [Syntrophales bacterium]
MELKACPKVYIHDTHRCRMPEDTLAFVAGMRHRLGMEDFHEISVWDRIGLPVFSCRRLRPDGSETYHTGKGISPVQAQVSLTMEAVERHCSEFKSDYSDRLVRGSWRELRGRHNLLDPRDLILPRFSEYDPEVQINWVRGYDIVNGEEILVPACAVYHPFHEDGIVVMATHTNGIASGNTLEEAVYHGLLEVVERDAWSIVKFARLTPPEIIPSASDRDFLHEIHRRLHQARVEVTLADYTSDLGIPVVAARIIDLEQPDMMPMDGFGAHLDPMVAAGRAMMEAATTRALLLRRFGPSRLRERPITYLEPEIYKDEEDQKPITLGDLPSHYTMDILADIEAVTDRLREAGLTRVIVVDLTVEDLGVPTARVIVPGLEAYGFDGTRIGERLFQPRTRD